MEKRIPKRVGMRVGVFGHSFVAYAGKYYTAVLNETCPKVKFSAHAKRGSGIGWVLGKLRQVRRGQYDEVIIHSGINDIAGFTPEKWERQMERTVGKLEKAVSLARRRGAKKIILVEATPWKGYESWNKDRAAYTIEYNRRMEEIARGAGDVELVKLYEMMEGGEPGAMKEEYSIDGLHPNKEGLLEVAMEIARTQYPEWTEEKEVPEVETKAARREKIEEAIERISEHMGLHSPGREQKGEKSGGEKGKGRRAIR